MLETKLKACDACRFYEKDAYDHFCVKFASVVTGLPSRMYCADARSDEGIPDGYALPALSVDSAQWGRPCGRGALHFQPKK